MALLLAQKSGREQRMSLHAPHTRFVFLHHRNDKKNLKWQGASSQAKMPSSNASKYDANVGDMVEQKSAPMSARGGREKRQEIVVALANYTPCSLTDAASELNEPHPFGT